MRAGEHPEELIDRAGRGALDPDEQAILQRHLEACAVCALQLSLASRFERELAPQPRDSLLSERAVEGAMQAPAGGAANRSRAAVPALVSLGGGGAAGVRRDRGRRGHQTTGSRRGLRSRPRFPPSHLRRRLRRSVRWQPPPAEAPVIPEAPPPEPAAKAPSAHGAAHPAITAEVLFERAEKLRRAGRADAAIATYRRLQAGISGDGGDPAVVRARGHAAPRARAPGRGAVAVRSAPRRGRRSQRRRGEVGEEALAGRATALEQLHRTSEAIAAWKSLLARYPRSVYAGRARARLDQLIEHR